MSFNKYFQDELAYLRELGREFSDANPKLAPFLADSGNDPDVERLLEGFAFLAGRIRQKLEDELPELTHSLITLLWPHFLRPVPSMSILEFQPIPSAMSGTAVIKKGVEVDSVPVEDTACRFRTCYDVDLHPLSLVKADLQRTAAASVLRLGFALEPGASLDRLGLKSLRLYLHGDPSLSKSLYLWLSRHLEKVTVSAGGGPGDENAFTLPPDLVRPVGFAEDEGLLPYPPNAFVAYRLLQEYFNLPEKFLFLDIEGLRPLARFKMADRFELAFEFSRPLEDQVRPKKDTFRLYCTPIVNLFVRDADPIRVDQTKAEYRVRPSGKEPSHYETYSIDQVEGWVQGTGKRRVYKAFESFEHVREAGTPAGGIFYRSRVYPAVVGRSLETYVSFVTAGDSRTMPPTETISIQLTCTNRNLAEKLRAGEIATPTGTSPEFARFRNVIPARPSVIPPLDSGLHWQLISNMSLNYVSLVRIEALRTVLSAYDFRAKYDRKAERESRLRLEGLVGVHTEPVDLLRAGLPVRGLRTHMEMRESNFAGEGDMYLFASVLNEFLSLFASINSFHQLIVTGVEHGEVYRWPAKSGQQLLL
ncbi:MAG: type VI secretion system baseplate subunit TssF [Kiloniellaceae bacterium]